MRLVLERLGAGTAGGRRVFGPEGGRIGGGPESDWVLPDPAGALGRPHARILFRDGRFWIACASPKGLVVNDGPALRRGQSRSLGAGDRIRLGGHELRVGEVSAASVPEPAPAPDQPEVWPVFLAGAGLDGAAEGAEALRQARRAGATLRALAIALHSLVQAEQAARREFGLPVAELRASGNNALRAVGEPSLVMRRLVGDTPGYRGGPEAVEEAVCDLAVHQIALIRGFRRALADLVGRFDPAVLARSAGVGPVSRSLPLLNKARCWDAYVAAHGRLVTDLTERLQALIGEALAASAGSSRPERPG